MINKEYIITRLLRSHNSFWKTAVNSANTKPSGEGKWSVSENVEHINIALLRLGYFLTLPKASIHSMYGASKKGSLSYKEFSKICLNTFSGKIQSTKDFIPQLDASTDLSELIYKGKKSLEKLIVNLKDWSEEELDLYNCPHPVFGKITVREILYFSIYHSDHHHQIIKRFSNRTI